MPVIDTRKFLISLILASLLSVMFGCARAVEKLEQIRSRDEAVRPEPENANLPLGNPSGAAADASDLNNFLILRDSHAVSYNNARGTANWVAWKVTLEDLGESLPRPDFRPDPELSSEFRRILPSDYSGSGFDRGHLVPSADRFGDPELHEQTFYMTNIVPQTKDLNQFPWQKFESYTRTLVRKGYDVYAIAGVLGEKGRLKNRVTIPASCWKILYIVPRGGSPLESGAAKVIAVEMPNEVGIARERWIKYKTSVRNLEQKTGYDLFSLLPVPEQERLETTID